MRDVPKGPGTAIPTTTATQFPRKNEFLIFHLSHTQVWTSQVLYIRQIKVEQPQMKLRHTFACLRAPRLEPYTWS